MSRSKSLVAVWRDAVRDSSELDRTAKREHRGAAVVGDLERHDLAVDTALFTSSRGTLVQLHGEGVVLLVLGDTAPHAHHLVRQGAPGRGVRRHLVLVTESPRRHGAQRQQLNAKQ